MNNLVLLKDLLRKKTFYFPKELISQYIGSSKLGTDCVLAWQLN